MTAEARLKCLRATRPTGFPNRGRKQMQSAVSTQDFRCDRHLDRRVGMAPEILLMALFYALCDAATFPLQGESPASISNPSNR